MRIEVNNDTNIFQYTYDNKIFNFDLYVIATDNMFFTYEDIIIDKCFGETFKWTNTEVNTDNMFETIYHFTFYFIITNNRIFLTKIKCKENKKIIYFDTFTYPKIIDDIFILYKVNDEKFILNLRTKEYFYVTNHNDNVIDILLNKLNSYTDIKSIDTQGRGYRFFGIKNGIKYDLFETYSNPMSILCNDQIHIF
jgi:hypothetical protein